MQTRRSLFPCQERLGRHTYTFTAGSWFAHVHGKTIGKPALAAATRVAKLAIAMRISDLGPLTGRNKKPRSASVRYGAMKKPVYYSCQFEPSSGHQQLSTGSLLYFFFSSKGPSGIPGVWTTTPSRPCHSARPVAASIDVTMLAMSLTM